MFKKKVLAILAVLAMVLGLVACGNKSTTTAAVETTVAETTAAKVEEKKSVNLEILLERDDSMINTYSLLAVDDAAPFVDADGKSVDDVAINTEGADALINWMLGEGESLAANFGYDTYGEYLFYLLDNAPKSNAEIPNATDATKTIRMSTTTKVLALYLPQYHETEHNNEWWGKGFTDWIAVKNAEPFLLKI